MRYVIIRDDDTNALTPVECLERLYRPFLDRGLPVNLATIPNVRSDVFLPGTGEPEGFLVESKGVKPGLYPIWSNPKLLGYLKANPGYKIVHHGCHHEFVGGQTEFDHYDREDIARRLDEGRTHLREAGFGEPKTFVAPYDLMTRVAYQEIGKRFDLISCGYFDRRRIPYEWWPQLVMAKLRKKPHWKTGHLTLLSHPGCHLSYQRPYPTMLNEIQRSIASRQLTVLVAHWWEFYRTGEPDLPYIQVLHETAEYLAKNKEIKVVAFEDVIAGNVPLD
jgi:hypothetical protein